MYYTITTDINNFITTSTLDLNDQRSENKIFCERAPIISLDKVINGKFIPATEDEIEKYMERLRPEIDLTSFVESGLVRRI